MGGIHEQQQSSAEPGMTPRTIDNFRKLIPALSNALKYITDFTTDTLKPKLIMTKDAISPITLKLAKSSLELSANTRQYIYKHPEVVAGVFYAACFHDNMPEIK